MLKIGCFRVPRVTVSTTTNFLDTSEKQMRKATISLIMSVCLFILPHGRARFLPNGITLNYVVYSGFLLKPSDIFSFLRIGQQ